MIDINSPVQRLKSLIEYLRQTVIKPRTIKDVANHKIFLQFEHTLLGLPGIYVDQHGQFQEEIWLSIDRLERRDPPEPLSDYLKIWMELSSSATVEPRIKESVLKEDLDRLAIDTTSLEEEKIIVAFNDFPLSTKVKSDLSDYLDNIWHAWATEEKKRRKTIKIYQDLFGLKQQFEGALDDQEIELNWGIGMVVWKINQKNICYPLMTLPVTISLNEKNMRLEVKPRRDLDFHLELAIYEEEKLPGIELLEKAHKELMLNLDESISPFEPTIIKDLLRPAVAHLSHTGQYYPDTHANHERALPICSEELIVTDTWVLFARNRDKNLFVQDLNGFLSKIEKDPDAIYQSPVAVKFFMEPDLERADISLPAFRGISKVGSDCDTGNHRVQELFFPKPFNEEQVQIVQKLEGHEGVVVQGPPGTGKTHTIANIICHYLANGQRVLVTSMKDSALKVLREKLPKEIQPLAVSLLTNDFEGAQNFEHSLNKIASEMQSIDRIYLNKKVAELMTQIDQRHANIAKIDHEIKQLAKIAKEHILFEAESIHPVNAAQDLIHSQGTYEWLEDELSTENTVLFKHADILRLKEARKKAGPLISHVSTLIPTQDDLPNLQEILDTHNRLLKHEELKKLVLTGELPPLNSSENDSTEKSLEDVLNTIDRMLKLLDSLLKEQSTFCEQLFLQIKRAPTHEAFCLLEGIGAELEKALLDRNKFIAKPINIPREILFNEAVLQAVSNKVQGKSAFGLKSFMVKKELKTNWIKIAVLGKRPESVEDWKHIYDYITLQQTFKELFIRWNAVMQEFSLAAVVEMESFPVTADGFYQCYKKVKAFLLLENELESMIKQLFVSYQKESFANLNVQIFLLKIKDVVGSHLNRIQLANKFDVKQVWLEKLSRYHDPLSANLKKIIVEKVGSTLATRETLETEWCNLIDHLQKIRHLTPDYKVIQEVSALIANSGATRWAEKLMLEPVNELHDPLLPENWRNIWRLRVLNTMLDRAGPPEKLKNLMKQRTDEVQRLAKDYERVVADKTWLKLAENMTPKIGAALESFRNSMSKIGKGTGKRAIRYRQDARKQAPIANQAVPCWIMPHYRVSESSPQAFGVFDLVIIDEASQSDFSALPAILRSKKILIVGDEEQVSPDGIGPQEDKIRELKKRFLDNQVNSFAPMMTPEKSIYDLCKVVFSGSGVMLREHFRCVGPIIEYSKREFYHDELVALRVPKASERIDPPLVDVYVENGYRGESDINKVEARFIIDEIKRITSDSFFQAGENRVARSIGVVSLQGPKQALHIREQLTSELGMDIIGSSILRVE